MTQHERATGGRRRHTELCAIRPTDFDLAPGRAVANTKARHRFALDAAVTAVEDPPSDVAAEPQADLGTAGGRTGKAAHRHGEKTLGTALRGAQSDGAPAITLARQEDEFGSAIAVEIDHHSTGVTAERQGCGAGIERPPAALPPAEQPVGLAVAQKQEFFLAVAVEIVANGVNHRPRLG